MIDRQKFDKAKRFLRRKYPVRNVHVIFVPRSTLHIDWEPRSDLKVDGDFCERLNKKGEIRYLIRICNTLTTKDAIATLCHEWAHLHQIAKNLPQISDHDRVFKALEAYFAAEVLEKC